MRRIGLAVLWLATLVSFAPVIGIVAAGAVATWSDCPLDEGAVHRCLVGGTDIGDSLYTAEVLGWLMILTWPGMLVCLGLWMGLLIRRVWRARASRRLGAHDAPYGATTSGEAASARNAAANSACV